jgi:hypothetical protein
MIHWTTKNIADVLAEGVDKVFSPGNVIAVRREDSPAEGVSRFTIRTAAGQEFGVTVAENVIPLPREIPA